MNHYCDVCLKSDRPISPVLDPQRYTTITPITKICERCRKADIQRKKELESFLQELKWEDNAKKAEIDLRRTVLKTNHDKSSRKYVRYRFVTFTMNKQSYDDYGEDEEEVCLKYIRAIVKSKTVPVDAYYGCKEFTRLGVPHYHVVFDIPPSKGLSTRGFSKSHLSNFWKLGNIDIQPVQQPYSTNLIKILNYIEKTKNVGNFFGDKKSFSCVAVNPDIPNAPGANDLPVNPDIQANENTLTWIANQH